MTTPTPTRATETPLASSASAPTVSSIASDSRVFPHMMGAAARRRVAQRGRRRLLQIGTLGWTIVDFVTGISAFFVGQIVSPYLELFEDRDLFVPTIGGSLTVGFTLAIVAHIVGLHEMRQRSDVVDLVIRAFTAVCLSLAVVSMGWTLITFRHMGRFVLIGAALSAFVTMALSRLIVLHWTKSFAQTVCFSGNDKFCAKVAQLVDDHPLPFKVKSIDDSLVHHANRLGEWAVANEIDEVIFDERSDAANDEALLSCMDAGIKVSSFTDFVEETYNFVPVDQIDARWLFAARVDLAHPYYAGVKRFLDIVVSIMGLILSAPLMVLAAISIKLTSRGGPVFYSQVRVGQFNRPFRIYKLRTMVTNAESKGAQWATQNDSRITPVGRFLRKTRIDEIPQFWNVLCGDMSLIGPRPERPEFIEILESKIPFYMRRHLIKPGLTGWAQINYPYGASIDDAQHKLTYDLYYIKNASALLDLQIFLRTMGAIMKGSR